MIPSIARFLCEEARLRTEEKNAARRLRIVVLSLAIHGGALAFVVWMGVVTRSRVVENADIGTLAGVEVAGGAHAVEIPLPARLTAADTNKPERYADAAVPPTLMMRQLRPQNDAGGGAPLKPHEGEGRGNAANGNGSNDEDARPAFPVFSPKPAVTERGLLPAAEEKIVVDVKVDEEGAVVSETLVKGLGNRLDEIVLETVKTWRFQPATVNGKPVETEAEIVFPFDLQYPVDGG
jgi:TonB family protein